MRLLGLEKWEILMDWLISKWSDFATLFVILRFGGQALVSVSVTPHEFMVI